MIPTACAHIWGFCNFFHVHTERLFTIAAGYIVLRIVTTESLSSHSMHFSATNVFSSRKLPVFSKRQKGSHKGNFGWCPRRRRRRSFRKCGVLCCVKKSMCQSWLQEVAQSFALNLCAVVFVVVARGLAYVRSSPYHCTLYSHRKLPLSRYCTSSSKKKRWKKSKERKPRKVDSSIVESAIVEVHLLE